MIVLGISHISNPSASVFIDGEMVAFAEEERFTRFKSSHGLFPGCSIKYCLEEANVSIRDVKHIAIPYNAFFYPYRFLAKTSYSYLKSPSNGGNKSKDICKNARKVFKIAFNNSPSAMRQHIAEGLLVHGISGQVPAIEFIDHHLCHALTAGCYSGFKSALVLIIDGSGEYNCTTLYDYNDGQLSLKEKYEIPNSLGWFYAGITEYLGFRPYEEEGKTMGLAPYGKYDESIIDRLSKILNNCSNSYSVAPEYLLSGNHSHGLHFSDLMVELLGPRRLRKETISGKHKNIAWGTQYLLEETVKKIVTRAINKYKRKNIALAGGVSMNCKMNGSILYDTPAEDVFAFPVSNDAGGAIGAAMHLTGSKAIKKLNHAYYGPSFSADKILNILENLKVPFSEPESIALKTAKLLEEGKLVGWFQGRMEFGPRALGDRSILANPLYPDIKDKINKTVKFREPWRPFCPSILNEHRSNYMEKDKESPFMIIAHRLQKNHRGTLSSICHIDGTIRPQTVSQEQNNLFYELLMEFERLTGYGVLLNTSFNVQGEPIVCNPTEAVRCFYGNGLDALAIGPYLLEKK